MENTLQFLIRHGYVVLFAWVGLEQGGLPIPSVPVLLAAGALAGTGHMRVALILGVGLAACLTSDIIWYEVGRRRGMSILHLLCRISLEPDSCVRQTEDVFSRRGATSLLLAKFVPGLSTVAPPLAGITRMPTWRFLFFDGMGALAWVGLFAGLGMMFSEQLGGVAVLLATMGSWLVALTCGALGTYFLWKFVARRRFLRRLRIARITVEELREKLDAGEDLVIVDLRHPLEFDEDPTVIPGAIRFSAKDLEAPRLPIPPDREIVLYCS